MSIGRREFMAAVAFSGRAVDAAAEPAPYPNHVVRVIVPAAAGGANDLIARIVCERLQAALGQPFIVDNRGGGGGLIGVDAVAKSPVDGHVLTLTYGGPVGSGLALFKSMPFDPFRDLSPIARVAAVEIVMVSSPSFKPRTVREVIDYARANPGMLKAAINSYGSMGHLLTEQFRLDNGIEINAVPYRGSAQAMPDVVSGQVDVMFDTVPGLQGLIKGGRLRPLALGAATRSKVLPDVPTFAELGMPRVEATTWYAVLGPANMPTAVIDRLSGELEKIMKQPEALDQLTKVGVVPFYAPPAETAAYMRSESVKWGRVVKAAGMQPE